MLRARAVASKWRHLRLGRCVYGRGVTENRYGAVEGRHPARFAHSSPISERLEEMEEEEVWSGAETMMAREPEAAGALFARQLALEEETVERTVARYRAVVESVTGMERGAALAPAQRLQARWFPKLVSAIDSEQTMVLGKVSGPDRQRYGPALLLLPPEKLAVLTMHTVLNTVLREGSRAKVTALSRRVGEAVASEIALARLRREDRKAWSKLQQPLAGRGAQGIRNRAHEALEQEWDAAMRVKVGAALVNLLLSTATVEVPKHVGLEMAIRTWHALAAAGRPAVGPRAHGGGISGGERERGDRDLELATQFEGVAAAYEVLLASKGLHTDTAQSATKAAAAARAAGIDGHVVSQLLFQASDGAVGKTEDDHPSNFSRGQEEKQQSMEGVPEGFEAMEWEDTVESLRKVLRGNPRLGAQWNQDSGVPLTESEQTVLRGILQSVESDGSIEAPALIHTYARERRKTQGIVRLHPWVLDGVESAIESHEHAKSLPMVVPPRDWTAPDSGAYLAQRVPLMRTHGSRLQLDVLREAHMPRVYEGLSVLGRVPWRINQYVLETAETLDAMGGGVAELPQDENEEVPVEPESDSYEDRAKWRRRRARALRTNAERHSLRCDLALKLSVAERFKDDVMYFPHNLDFRGRVYPVPPHLNHMGSDLCRGLLRFAEPRPLGDRGLYWLKVHLANLFGVDKVPLHERAAFTDENLERVFATARDPVHGDRWWTEADSPFQALATCKELHDALHSSNPQNYLSTIPVHQDGSCNGLQHYAALGRDFEGARAVNLVRSDRPRDVYSEVLGLVLERLNEDCKLDLPGDVDDPEVDRLRRQKECAKLLVGVVDRKVIKQTVMTSVYGVTFIGARDQVLARLEERIDEPPPGVDAEELDSLLWDAAGHLARTTLTSIGTLFERADAIKAWLTHVARLVAVAEQPMCWITPLGLPVAQPYRRSHAMIIKTALQGLSVADADEQLPVSAQKQGSAFPPNYVHSLDSSHMLMTAIDCSRRGLVFTAVHDSFWTHARDVDVMNASLRDQFVRLYSLPLLEQLRDSLTLRFPQLEIPPLPSYGNLDLEYVRDAPFFFS